MNIPSLGLVRTRSPDRTPRAARGRMPVRRWEQRLCGRLVDVAHAGAADDGLSGAALDEWCAWVGSVPSLEMEKLATVYIILRQPLKMRV